MRREGFGGKQTKALRGTDPNCLSWSTAIVSCQERNARVVYAICEKIRMESQAMSEAPAPEAVAQQFHFEEYRRLIQEIQTRLQTLSEFEKYSIFGMAAFYSWYFSQSHSSPSHSVFLPYVLWLPVVLSALGLFRCYTTRRRIYAISKYVVEIEKVYALRSVYPAVQLCGWETLMQPNRDGWRFYVPTSDPTVTWLVLLPVTALIAFLPF